MGELVGDTVGLPLGATVTMFVLTVTGEASETPDTPVCQQRAHGPRGSINACAEVCAGVWRCTSRITKVRKAREQTEESASLTKFDFAKLLFSASPFDGLMPDTVSVIKVLIVGFAGLTEPSEGTITPYVEPMPACANQSQLSKATHFICSPRQFWF